MPLLPIGLRGLLGLLDREIVSATMAYPRDEVIRNQYLVRFVEQMMSRAQEEFSQQWNTVEERVNGIARLGAEYGVITLRFGAFHALAGASGWDALKDRLLAQAWRGSVAGDVLVHIVQLEAADRRGSVNRAVAVVCDYLNGATTAMGENLGASERFIRQQWEHFKPVAHLWAAFRVWQFANPEARTGPEFYSPFTQETLPAFLAVSEWFLAQGVGHRARGARHPTLNEDEAWRTPPEIELPPVTINVPPLAEWQAAALHLYNPRRD